jgi:Ca2+-binding RTX toxin-like protein
MRALQGVAVVSLAAAALVVAQAAPSPAADGPRLTCFGMPATIVGTPGPDWLFGGPDDVVVGLGGDDILGGGTVCGGVGNDGLSGYWRVSSHLDGGDGDDIIRGEVGPSDVLLGGVGNDFVTDSGDTDYEDSYDPGIDVMKGGPGDDILASTCGRNLVYGNAGNDHIGDYTNARTAISGGAGDDLIDSVHVDNGPNPVEPDLVAGDAGRDSAIVDRADKVRTTEEVTYVY